MASFDNSPFLRQKISTRLYPKPTSFSTGVFVRWSRSGFDPAPAVLCRAFHKASGFLRIAEAGPSRQLFRLFDYRQTQIILRWVRVRLMSVALPVPGISFHSCTPPRAASGSCRLNDNRHLSFTPLKRRREPNSTQESSAATLPPPENHHKRFAAEACEPLEMGRV